MISPRTRSPFGELLRRWRQRRGLSQLGLATRAGTTPRHVSFLETGRSRPGAALVARLAEVLAVPRADRDRWHIAAGLAPQTELLDADIVRELAAIAEPLALPAIVYGPAYEICFANVAATLLLPEIVRAATIVEAFTGRPARARLDNTDDVAWAWHDRIAAARPDSELLPQLAAWLRGTPRLTTSLDPRPSVRGVGAFVSLTMRLVEAPLPWALDVLCPIGPSLRTFSEAGLSDEVAHRERHTVVPEDRVRRGYVEVEAR